MKRILCSDWLPEWARWAHFPRWGFPALVLRKAEKVLFWTRWLNIGLVQFFGTVWRNFAEVNLAFSGFCIHFISALFLCSFDRFLYCFQTTLRLFSYNFILFLHFCILFLMYFHNICVLLLFFFCGILILFSKYFYFICKYEYFTKFRNRLNSY